MRADSVNCLQMLRVHEKTGKFIAVHLQPEQYAQSHIVNAALHGSVHGFCVVIIIALRSCGMQFFVALLMVSLLEQDIGADAGVF